MENYRDKGTFWLMENSHKIATELSGNNPVAATAILSLLQSIKGARAFGRMLVELLPEEWDKLYRLCDEEPKVLASNMIAINAIMSYHNNGERIIHKNLSLMRPALFTETELEDPHGLYQKDYSDFCKRCTDNFLPRYKRAKDSR